ncbi:hypothetical protein BGX21_006996 [Mortierella sp. AD011]|nr:hypothetical protein BGX20_003296 [Mortierella sp. AD010]KAF9398969.1 hypothetical protein BGX21_006996 [Mortierella sp. AD011]
MTKRNSASDTNNANDVDMTAVDQGSKKPKICDDVFAYPKDEYTIECDFLKSSRFEILYMATRARAEVPRMLLEYVGANYSSAAPVDWPAGKKETPFGLLPVLTHVKPSGEVFTVPEVPALTRYLGRLFGLTGKNFEEDAILDACFQSATDNILNVLLMEVWMKPDPKNKECINTAFEKLVPIFDGFERYLAANGSNGYLLGEKTTFGEFPIYDWLEHFYKEYPENAKALVSETVRPSIYKLYKRFDSNPRIRAYIDGGRWEYRPASPMISLYSAGVIVSNWDEAFEFYNKKLGLKCVRNVEVGGDGGRYAEFVVNEQEKTRFTIYTSCKDTEIPKRNGGISFTVRSVKDTHDGLVKKGVSSKMGPTKMPWGEMAQVADPDGNVLTLNSGP